MPNLFGETCFDCMRPLRTDGREWDCPPCGRGGYYALVRIGERVIRVRMVTRWRRAAELPESTFERIRRAA